MTAAVEVLHVITRLIVGGAQENTVATVAGLARGSAWSPRLLTGPETGPEGSLLDEARAAGVALEILPSLRREIRPLADARAAAALAARFRGGVSLPPPRIVHTHSSKAGLLGRWAGNRARVPGVVHTVHGWSFHERLPAWRRALFVALERRAARWCHSLIVVSEADLEIGLAHRIGRREQYTLIRSGIDLARFACPARSREAVRAELAIPRNATVVGTVGRLSAQKAPLDFVECCLRLGSEHPDLRFLLVGDGPLRAAVEERVRSSPIAGRFVLAGLRRDIPELLGAIDLFLLTSLWEGLPRVLPQAMAAGVPIVATRTAGAREAIAPGEAGLLVEPGDVGALAASAKRLLDEPGLAAVLVERGRIASRGFGLEAMLDRIETVYRRCLDARS